MAIRTERNSVPQRIIATIDKFLHWLKRWAIFILTYDFLDGRAVVDIEALAAGDI